MKYIITGLLSLTLFGCSLSVPQPPIAKQSNDLFDNDNDGVINQRDNCAQTPIDAVVDNDGCPTYVKHSEANKIHVLFAHDSDMIPDEYISQLKKMGNFLHQYPKTHIEIKGYASPVGSSNYNIGLSERRASNVRRQLIAEGIQPSRIKIIGFGDKNPIKAENTEQTNTLSRRVTAQVIGSQDNVLKEWTIYTVREN